MPRNSNNDHKILNRGTVRLRENRDTHETGLGLGTQAGAIRKPRNRLPGLRPARTGTTKEDLKDNEING